MKCTPPVVHILSNRNQLLTSFPQMVERVMIDRKCLSPFLTNVERSMETGRAAMSEEVPDAGVELVAPEVCGATSGL